MFEIPDDDDFWEDFPLEETKADDQATSKIHSLSKKTNEQGSPQDSSTVLGASAPKKKQLERKFPGPAGLLPKSPASGDFDSCVTEFNGVKPKTEAKDNVEVCVLPASQSSTDDLCDSLQWRRMLEDLGEDADKLLKKFSIKSTLLRASRRMLHKGKAPLVIGMLESLDMQGPDASFVIKDETGKMKGSLHKDLIQDPSTSLQAGYVLILRQVSVISPSARTHYLNLTTGNVTFLYSSSQDAGVVVKRSWPPSPVSQPNPSSESNREAAESPSLQEIIKESERELNASLDDFPSRQRNRLSAVHQSSTSQLSVRPGQGRGQSSLFNHTLPQTSLHRARLPSRTGPAVGSYRPTHVRPPCDFRPWYKPVPPKFSAAGGLSSESPLPSPVGASSTPGMRGSLHQAPPPLPSRPGITSYGISSETATRQNNRLETENFSKASAWQLNPPKSYNTDLSNSSRAEAGQGKDRLQLSSVEFDFAEDNEDLLSLCDENVVDWDTDSNDPNSFLRMDKNPAASTCDSNLPANSVISSVFNDCFIHNNDINNEVSKNQLISNSSVSTSKQPPDKNNQGVLSSNKRFNFKRSSVPCPAVSQLPISHTPKRRCPDGQTPTSYVKEMSGFTDLDLSIETQKAESSSSGAELQPQACVSAHPVTGSRDARVQLGSRPLVPPAPRQEVLSEHLDKFAHWGDDLTDDLLLSQLSEEF